VGTEVASSILIRALQSFREALIKDDESKIAEIDAFLTLDEKNSLVRRMTTFYAALTAVRDRILSVSADSDVYRERSAVRDRVLSVGADSDVYRERLAMRDHVLKVWRYFHAS
jgi:molecular chaperone GrpE